MTEGGNCSTIFRVRRTLLALAAIALAWSAIVFAAGGIQFRIAGTVFRSRDPQRALFIAIMLIAAMALLDRKRFARETARVADRMRRAAAWLAAVAAIVIAAHAFRDGALVAGGSDAYGYVSQAYGWARGPLPRAYPLQLTLPFRESDWIQAPLGHRPGPRAHTMVPTYAPGLPLLMAGGIRIAGPIGPYLIVPLCAGLFVWFTFLLGRRTAGPLGGLIAAVLAATSPVVLFQSLQPMSDVPAGALWTAAAVAGLGESRRGATVSGLATAIGLLVRPNLALLALVPFGQVVLAVRGRERIVRAVLFCLSVVPVALAIGALNAAWYGSPFASGYGRGADLYSTASVWPNLQRYPVWLWRSQSPWILLAGFSLVGLVRPSPGRRAIRVAWILFATTVLCYIAYAPFEEWWYLRFLLPGLGAFFALVATGLLTVTRRIPSPWGGAVVFVVVLLIARHAVGYAEAHDVFRVKGDEYRYAEVGDFINRALPGNAVVFALQHSGSIRFYGGRLTLRYDFVGEHPERAAADLERLELHPYLAIDDFEIPQVYREFGLPTDRPLPWPTAARMRESGGVTIYDLATHPQVTSPVAIERGGSPRYAAPKEMVLTRQ